MELKNGGADAVLIDNIMAEIYCKQNSDLQYESVPSTAEDTVFCIEKGNTELVQIINDGLAKVKKSGVYDDLYQQYFVDTVESSEDVTDVAATDGFLGLLSFIFLQDNRWKFYINGLGITLIVSLLSVIVGILIGLVGAAIPLGLLYVVYNRVISYVMTEFSVLSNFMAFMPVSAVFRILLPVGLILGMGIGLVGSIFTIRKHLKV